MVDILKARDTQYEVKESLFKGFKAHSCQRVEHLVIGRKTGDIELLKANFNTLCHRLVGKSRNQAIQYAGVFVKTPSPHAHILWIKPYIRYEQLGRIWEEITKEGHTSIRTTTVRGDKSLRNDVRKLVDYIVFQGDHHHTTSEYLQSKKWLVTPKKYAQSSGQQELAPDDG